MNELHLKKKDFKVEWFSGSGAGGQHRNKHQNCCRITHLASGLKCNGTGHKSRVANLRSAFMNLAKLILSRNSISTERYRASEVIRNYNAVRNECLDKASRTRLPYTEVLDGNGIGIMIEARRATMT